MFRKKKQEKNLVIDITHKRVKTWWGGTKLVPTTKAEQRKMRDIIMHIDPSVTIIDSKSKKERELEWIDRIEEFDAFLNL